MPESILTNYHTHTPRCHHAVGTEEDYIQTALRCGYKTLGFSDHTPWAYDDPSFVSHMRMVPADLEDYVRSLRALREKYASQLSVRIGLEVEYFPAYLDWLTEESQRLGIEYWVFGCHYDTTDNGGLYFGRPKSIADVRRYAEQIEAGLETGRFVYLAHPDLILNFHDRFGPEEEQACREICAAAVKHDIPLEYNLHGILVCRDRTPKDGTIGYTTDRFWQIASEYPIRAILGSDAHDPKELENVALMREKEAFLRGLGIEVIHTLPGLE